MCRANTAYPVRFCVCGKCRKAEIDIATLIKAVARDEVEAVLEARERQSEEG